MVKKATKSSNEKSSVGESPSEESLGEMGGLDFEAALNQLQDIVERMESNQQSLEDSLKDYELGSRLAAQCQQRLDQAQLKVERTAKTANGYSIEPLASPNNGE